MNVISVKYEKLHHSRAKKYPDASWEFVVVTDTTFPHNADGFGGVLRRVPDGEGFLWQARHYDNTDWAAPQLGREKAIQALLPIAFEAIKEWKDEQKAADARLQARYAEADDLRKELQMVLPGIIVKLGVNAWRNGQVSDEPLEFVIELSKLSKKQVQTFTRIFKQA